MYLERLLHIQSFVMKDGIIKVKCYKDKIFFVIYIDVGANIQKIKIYVTII